MWRQTKGCEQSAIHLGGHDEVCLGKFSDYVQLVYELPDLSIVVFKDFI